MATSVTLKPNAIDISGSTSGTTTLQASAVAGTTTLTLPAATDTLVGKATTDTLTNKTLTGAAMNGTLGATTPSTASVTTLTTSSTVTHSGGTANGVAYLDGSKVLTTGSALVFDGTNLGVGVTPSAWNSVYRSIQLGSTAGISGRTESNLLELSSNSYRNSGGAWTYLTTSSAARYDIASGVHNWYNAPSGTAGNAITFTQAMTLDASGNLGVGTTSPYIPSGSTQRTIEASSTGLVGSFYATATQFSTVRAMLVANSFDNTTSTGSVTNHPFLFLTNNTERARIDSSGNLLVGTTNTAPGTGNTATGCAFNGSLGIGYFSRSSDSSLIINTNADGIITRIHRSGSLVGSISVTTTSTTYNTSSDYRLKNITGPITGAEAKNFIMALQPKQGIWKVNGSPFAGFVAHEFQEVSPSSVIGEKDAVDENGNPVMQAMQASSPEVMANIVALIQEQQAIIQSLTARITALEST